MPRYYWIEDVFRDGQVDCWFLSERKLPIAAIGKADNGVWRELITLGGNSECIQLFDTKEEAIDWAEKTVDEADKLIVMKLALR